ncbi:MAG: BPL-N domain-containing protein [Nitrospirota bacterium]|nr:BPL-N domain-containing protein [Nitrospirota bacterium]
MKANIASEDLESASPAQAKAAFLWDESFLWGLMACKALKENGLLFDLIRSEEIKNGGLKAYSMLFVPGGWASNKLKSLGDDGVEEIRRFIKDGGNYLGICGGAGLATRDCMGLLNVKRKPTKERVPSFSGRIYLNTDEHPVWKGVTDNPGQAAEPVKTAAAAGHPVSSIFNVWWPSQFLIKDSGIKILATYGNALPDSFSSDLNVGDIEAVGGWSELEDIYQINLDPGRLLHEPAVIESASGGGRVVLSLVHFDTPGDRNGAVVLNNLWTYLDGRPAGQGIKKRETVTGLYKPDSGTLDLFSGLYDLCSELISVGVRNFLWFWRNPMFLQWRRGVRGLEYCTLFVMIKEILEILRGCGPSRPGNRETKPAVSLTGDASSAAYNRFMTDCGLRIKELLTSFVDNAGRLLVLERHSLRNGHITYDRCDDPEIIKIRKALFSGSKSHGGLFKKLINEVDSVLFLLLKEA